MKCLFLNFRLKWNNVWIVFLTLALLIFILLPLTWFYALYKKFFSKTVIDNSNNYFLSFIKCSATLVSTSAFLRVVLYLIVSGLIAACTILDMVDCDHKDVQNKTTYYFDGKETILCLDPWVSDRYLVIAYARFYILEFFYFVLICFVFF